MRQRENDRDREISRDNKTQRQKRRKDRRVREGGKGDSLFKIILATTCINALTKEP